MKNSFGSFIITYERPIILKETISKILAQSLCPEKILIVDNSESFDTKIWIENEAYTNVEYYRVGYNAGPAGAAKIGLQKLADEGYRWIYWGDDNDPPHFEDSFEKLIALGNRDPQNTGIVGVVGQYFNTLSGELVRVPDASLYGTESLEIDSIAGGQCMIVNADLIRKGCLPNGELFFGFEELDFCIRAKKLAYKLVVPTDLFLRSREKFNRLNRKKSFQIFRKKEALKREYYSVRNMIIILRDNKLYRALLIRVIKSIARVVFGFSRGFEYGYTNFRYIFMGLYHSLIRKSGKVY
jgi:GT2 family glycosyltransferase